MSLTLFHHFGFFFVAFLLFHRWISISGFTSYVVRAPAGQVSWIIGLMARVDVWPTGPVGKVI
ncbi:hypothetical protein BDV24DRAFT_27469 [Aspergillus arachidicola]|uniref:Uncharacterized protein n=1 Tax=Aspergillus arachidicola TaxID=656916 RepID=A0A5N6YGB1_9EURO|nr:hypothetical protein BDV24DRAFT_27469 [Aspergillus arachidicola]